MKKHLLFVLFCLPLSLMAQNSFPLLGEKPSWRVYVSTFQSYMTNFSYEKDTLVDNKTYSKVKSYNFLVRNEGKKTFIRTRSWNGTQYNREFLLYDFDLRVGDSAFVGQNTFSIGRTDSTVWVQVKTIDSVTIGATQRKRLTLNYMRCGLSNRPLTTMEWVEGIGCLDNPFYSTMCLCDGCEHRYYVFCFQLDTDSIYKRGTTCNPIISTKELTQLSKTRILPNPFMDFIELEQSDNVHKILVFNALGGLMKTFDYQRGQKIDVADLPKGLFVFKYFDNKNQWIGTNKAVKCN